MFGMKSEECVLRLMLQALFAIARRSGDAEFLGQEAAHFA
jgi:hypothetical protein